MSGKSIEFWFEFGSTYSYLTAARIEQTTEVVGIEIEWRPFLLGPIFGAQGWNDSPFNIYPAKGRYMWRDMERLAEHFGLPFKRPSSFPRQGLIAARVALIAGDEGWCPDWTRAVYAANFAEDLDIGDPAVLSGLLETLGQEPGRVLAAADQAPNKQRLRSQTDRAIELGIFGAPSFIVGDELYWGNDRLGDAVARAALG